MAGSAGGYGLWQWTGIRRTLFMNWCHANKRDPADIETNVDYFVHEVRTSYPNLFAAVNAEPDLEKKVIRFELIYERAAKEFKRYDVRLRWAKIALDEYAKRNPPFRDLFGKTGASPYDGGRVEIVPGADPAAPVPTSSGPAKGTAAMGSLAEFLIKSVLGNPSIENAILGVLSTVVGQLFAHSNNPDAIKAIATDLGSKGPALVAAILHGTPAASQASPAAAQQAQDIAARHPDLISALLGKLAHQSPASPPGEQKAP